MTSNAYFDEWVATFSADILEVVPAPDRPTLYGVDIRLYDDISPAAENTTYDSREGLAQDLYHRLRTSPGQVPDDEDFGYNLVEQLSVQVDDLSAVAAQIQAELEKDDRVQRVEATINRISGEDYSIELVIFPQEDIEEFQLILKFSDFLGTITE